MTILTAKTNISDTYPLPSNATARTAMANIWDVINEFTEKPEIDIATAATCDIGAALSTKLKSTGSVGTTSFGTTYRGPVMIRVGAAWTITHNSTILICPGGVNLACVAGDILLASPKSDVSGTANGWQVAVLQGALNVTGTLTMSGAAINQAVGTNIASAASINLTAATGNLIHVTGSTTVTAVTLGAGMSRTVIFDGALTLTHHATNNKLPGAANITTAAGDRADYWSDGTTVYCANYTKADGTAVVASAGLSSKYIGASRDLSTASGTQDITGFGFNPTSAIVFAAIGITFQTGSWGFADSAAGQWSVNQRSAGGIELGTTFIDFGPDNGNLQRAVLSYITDGVRLTWTKSGTPTGSLQIGIMGMR